MSGNEINKQRYYVVAKSNEFIQKSRFKLSVVEQKLIWFIISKIKYDDEDFKYYEFSHNEFCKVCNIDPYSGGNYEIVKTAIKVLADKSMWIDTNPGEVSLTRWLDKARINKGSGQIMIRLDEDLKPYLLKLKENYTTLDLSVALSMKSKYSIRLYEILKCYVGLKKWSFKIDDLKEKMDIAKDKRFADFKKDMLVPAIKEIKKYADFDVDFTLEKIGRFYTDINFVFKNKTLYENHKAIQEIEKILGGK